MKDKPNTDKRHSIYPGKPSWGRKPNKASLYIDSTNKYNVREIDDLPRRRIQPTV